ncbi:MAG: DUF4339 domain-containing protein [Verrucomicrobiae bacterium]|nr:DUF4339 domain-containing protein [Verrucomicrobiae bacterium]
MYHIIGWDGKQYGPVSAADLRAWRADRRVNDDTQVCPVDGGEWKPLSAYPELMEGAAPLAAALESATPVAWEMDASRTFSIGRCVGRGWEVVRGNLFPSIGVTLVIGLVYLLISMVPLIGSLLALVAQGILYGGLYWYFLKQLRGEGAEFGDAFAGFKRNTKDLILAGVVQGVILFAVVLVAVIPMVALGVGIGGAAPKPSLESLLLVVVPLALLLAVVVAVLSMMWMFSFPLVIDRGIGFWQAMEMSRKAVFRRLGSVIGLLLVCSLMMIAGALILIVGLLVALPVCAATLAAAYDELFGSPAASPS